MMRKMLQKKHLVNILQFKMPTKEAAISNLDTTEIYANLIDNANMISNNKLNIEKLTYLEQYYLFE